MRAVKVNSKNTPLCEASMKRHKAEPIVIKKYANRRLYNTDTSSYVTLDDLCDMVKQGADFIVYDAKSGDDLTRQVLTQIIFEQEGRGENLLPIGFLRNLIGFYDNNLKDFVPAYLDTSMQNFVKHQAQMQEMVGSGNAGNPTESFSKAAQQLEQLGKQNMELFAKTFQMFAPFASGDAAKKK
jgi:polyhydroxyalkanoate synthesis repressor PhaR